MTLLLSLLITLLLLIICAAVGRRLLAECGLRAGAGLGAGLVAGYAILGLLMLLALRYLGEAGYGVVAFAGAAALLFQRGRAASLRPAPEPVDGALSDGPRTRGETFAVRLGWLLILLWALVVTLTYLPTAMSGDAFHYRLPKVFDLPKHFLAGVSLFEASAWPPPSPFLAGESFAYNYLFYMPPVWAARLVGDSMAFHATFSLVLVAVAVALPLVLLDVASVLVRSPGARLGVIMMGTWTGGLMAVWVDDPPVIGFRLQAIGAVKDVVWIDEIFVSAIYVPQHILAILCGMVTMLVLARGRSASVSPLLVAGSLTAAGILTSLILLPHLLLSYGVGLLLSIGRVLRTAKDNAERRRLLLLQLSGPLALLPAVPFVLEAAGWSQGVGLFGGPILMSKQWFYVAAAAGIVVPLAVIAGLGRWLPGGPAVDGPEARDLQAGIAAMCLIGLLGLLALGYPDAGLKSGLWLRICLVPLAGVGLATLINGWRGHPYLQAVPVAVIVGIALFNLPTPIHIAATAWTQADDADVAILKYLRQLPSQTRVILIAPTPRVREQKLVARAGRRVDFDFSLLRPDHYMPPSGRERAERFWQGLPAGEAAAWEFLRQHYDVVIAPVGADINREIRLRLGEPQPIGAHLVYLVGNASTGGRSTVDEAR